MEVVEPDKVYVSGTQIGEPGKDRTQLLQWAICAGNRQSQQYPGETWECTEFTPMSLQVIVPKMAPDRPLREDCLYLNIALGPRAASVRLGLGSTGSAVSEAVMELWTSFARTGKPRAKGIPEWPEHSRATDRYLCVSGKSEVRSGFSKLPGKWRLSFGWKAATADEANTGGQRWL
jgi:carboxylesterase type B